MVPRRLADNGPIGDLHTVPTVEIDIPDGAAVKAYAKTSGATATLVPGNTGTLAGVPAGHRVLLAGTRRADGQRHPQAGPRRPGRRHPRGGGTADASGPSLRSALWNAMAAPHVAGLAAIYTGVHAGLVADGNQVSLDDNGLWFAENRDPAQDRFLRSGCRRGGPVQDAQPWCTTPARTIGSVTSRGSGVATATGVPAIDPSDYNQASIADGALVGAKTITRTVTALTPGLYRGSNHRARVPGDGVPLDSFLRSGRREQAVQGDADPDDRHPEQLRQGLAYLAGCEHDGAQPDRGQADRWQQLAIVRADRRITGDRPVGR